MDYRKYSFSAFICSFFLLFLTSGCQEKNSTQSLTGEALGTTYQILFFHPQELKIQKSVDSIFHVINESMSTYQEDSDISRINKGDTTIKVDSNFKEVFFYSEKLYQESNGYFDPTVGNIVNSYGFGPDSKLDSFTDSERDSLFQYVGFNKLKLSSEGKILKEQPGIYLDFNAIAKGYAVDVIARILDGKKVENYLVEVGGELVGKGENLAKEQAWVVAIDDPLQSQGERTYQTTLFLKNRAMATSGNYRKFKVDSATGKRFVHTINPLTGRSEKSNLLSVSVLAENCALADGYATAFMAMGYERSRQMLEDLENVDVYFIYGEQGKEVKVFASEGFEEALLTN